MGTSVQLNEPLKNKKKKINNRSKTEIKNCIKYLSPVTL